jgi:hypothetical protein
MIRNHWDEQRRAMLYIRKLATKRRQTREPRQKPGSAKDLNYINTNPRGETHAALAAVAEHTSAKSESRKAEYLAVQ